MGEILSIKITDSMYFIPDVKMDDKLQRQLKVLQDILNDSDYCRLLDAVNNINFKIGQSIGCTDRLLRLLAVFRRKYLTRISNIVLRNFSKEIKKIILLKKTNHSFNIFSDDREEIRFLKNNFKHFDDEENVRINDHLITSINFNKSNNEFKNRTIQTNKLCAGKL
ncbi:hypothetical protein [uncultured Chryseobacterium sp.]|uniref:hypothetical protein n=1 Tax=uncultured Chryseobacterium sp. TaxID=259322 RepID=UPI0025F7BD03|nr:hypothetical protein [uncultured Chryseobacterium sp.]